MMVLVAVLYVVLSSSNTKPTPLTVQTSSSMHPKSPKAHAPSASQPEQPSSRAYDGSGAWSYDFSDLPDGPLPARDWNFVTGTKAASYNQEAEAYTSRPSNVRVQDGNLIIEARKEKMYGKDYTSARVNTKGLFAFTYGTLEVTMKKPKGVGTWPAAWLMPRDKIYHPKKFGIKPSDPYAWALNGEIDFAESIGSIPGQNIPATHSYNSVQRRATYTPGFVANPYTEFHRYGVVKTPDKITFTIDGAPFASRAKTNDSPLEWPFNQPYYLILSLAVGGNWAGDNGIDAASAPWQLAIKSISYKPL
jgi:beta-glucanase (GH16 family)